MNKTDFSENMRNSYTILVVDDEPMNIFLLSKMLNLGGYLTISAGTGMEALHILHTRIPDLVLLDLMMPRMNGYEVMETMKKENILFKVPVIIISALTEEEKKEQAFQSGASDYLTKPVKQDDLFNCVAKVLNSVRDPIK